jgi:MFS family permease
MVQKGRVSSRGLWLALFVLFAPCASAISVSLIAPLLTPLAQTFGGKTAAQQIVVTPFFGFAVAGVTAGWIIDLFGAKPVIIISTLAFMLAGSSGLYATSAPVLLAGSFGVGFSSVVLSAAAFLILAEAYADHQRSRMLGFTIASGGLANSGATLLSGVTADAFGWRMSFLIFVAAGVACLLLALLGLRNTPPAERRSLRFGLSGQLPLLPIYGCIAFALMVAVTSFTHIPLLLGALGNRSTALAGVLMSCQGAASMAMGLVYGPVIGRAGRIATPALALCFGVAGMLAAGIFPSAYTFAASCIGLGLMLGLLVPFLTEEVMRVAAPSVRSQALGLFQTAEFGGGYVNPFVLAPITAMLGLHGAYIALGISLAVLGLAGIFLYSRYQHREQLA